MLRKRDVVQGNPELHSMLSNIDVSDGEVLFRSEQYLQIGCDLRDLPALDAILASAVDIENCRLISARFFF
jgi:tRNA wybutosine-synthesizing protein 4